MSWICLEGNKTSKARKLHRCDVCGSKIEKGEVQVTRTGVEPGEGYTRMHMHPECEEFSSDWDDSDWECYSSGGYTRAEIRAELEIPPL